MGRPISQTLQELLDEDSCRTQSTLELRLLNGAVNRYATDDDVTVGGILYGDELRKTGEIIQSAFSNVDRTTSQVENVDKVIGLQILNGSIDRGAAIVGREYRSESDPNKTVWVELFRGEAKPREVEPETAAIEIVDDLVAAGYCVAAQTLEPACPLLYGSPECGADPSLPPCSHNLETCRILHRFAGMETKIEVVATLPGDSGGGIGGDGGGGDLGGGGGRCFIAGTLIATPNGRVAIENIRERGDVLSFNRRTLEVETDTVVRIMEHVAPGVFEFAFSNGAAVSVTPEHPFLTARDEFTRAGDLRIGQRIFVLTDNRLSTAEITGRKWMQGAVKVYNFHVARNQTYFADGFAVHNRKEDFDFYREYQY